LPLGVPWLGDWLRLGIIGNGRGLSERIFARGAGLERMAHCAEEIDGVPTFGPARGGGTQVLLELPDYTHGNTNESRQA